MKEGIDPVDIHFRSKQSNFVAAADRPIWGAREPDKPVSLQAAFADHFLSEKPGSSGDADIHKCLSVTHYSPNAKHRKRSARGLSIRKCAMQPIQRESCARAIGGAWVDFFMASND